MSFSDFLTAFSSGLANSGATGGLAAGARGFTGSRKNVGIREATKLANQGDWQGAVDTLNNYDPDSAFQLASALKTAQDQKTLSEINKSYNTTNEIKNYEALRGMGVDDETARNIAFKIKETSSLTPYDKEVQKQQAIADIKGKKEQQEKIQTAQQTASDLEDTMKFVEGLPEVIVGPYAGGLNAIGAFTGGNVGLTDEQQMLKGELDRRVGEIENQIIAVARQNGQTGINTMAEIRQAAKGIATAKSKPALLGALKHMKELQQKYVQMGQKGLVENDEAQMTTIQPQENVVDYTEYFK